MRINTNTISRRVRNVPVQASVLAGGRVLHGVSVTLFRGENETDLSRIRAENKRGTYDTNEITLIRVGPRK